MRGMSAPRFATHNSIDRSTGGGASVRTRRQKSMSEIDLDARHPGMGNAALRHHSVTGLGENVIVADSHIREDRPVHCEAPFRERPTANSTVGKIEPRITQGRFDGAPSAFFWIETRLWHDATEDASPAQIATPLSRDPPAQLGIRPPEDRILRDSAMRKTDRGLALE